MKTKFIFLQLILNFTFSYAQKENNIWYFSEAGIEFSSGSPIALTNSAMYQVEGSASICDAQGNLLFYTDGITVWNSTHQQMPNGFDLLGSNSSTQSALIVPKPQSCNIYYIFTVPAQDSITPLCYSIVDLSLDGGMGDIVSKNTPLHTPVTERLTATLKSNGTDYWVLAQEFNTNGFLAFSVTSDGINTTPIISYIGPDITDINMDVLGYMKISPDGSKLCYASLYGSISAQLFDFDNNTGIVSNAISLYNYHGYGVEFSPDNSKLYIETANAPFIITQYSLQAGTASATQIVYQFMINGYAQYGGALQLGPDDKIYINRLSKGYLGVINKPNLLGTQCEYVDSAIYLSGKNCQDGLPNCIKQYSNFCNSVSSIVVPNVFTPNDDGINDEFKIMTNNITLMSCKIYNRWGILVGELARVNAKWDGRTTSGIECKTGVYYYTLSATGEDAKEYKEAGFLTLLK